MTRGKSKLLIGKLGLCYNLKGDKVSLQSLKGKVLDDQKDAVSGEVIEHWCIE